MDQQQAGVMEGFLCPVCIIDLKSPVELSSHFEEAHADDKVVQQFKSVISKAKRTLLKENNAPSSRPSIGTSKADVGSKVFVSNGRPETGGIDLSLWEKQKIGFCTSRTNEFCEQRKEAIEGVVVETNKLIIRLEKLIKSGIYAPPSLPLPVVGALRSKKTVEKSVVPWDSDNNTKACNNCSKKFSLTYRRHHCRLCGKVICSECVDNLDMTIACGVLKLNAEKASLYVKFVTDDNENENGLKVCDTCNELLARQNKLIQDKLANNNLLQLYEKMQTSMREADSTQPKYLRIAESINSGETEFNLEVATEMRLRLLKSYESIEALSKRIQQLGLEKEKQPNPQILKLQRSIRQYASNYLTENMFILPSLPTPDKYAEILRQKASGHEQLKTGNADKLSQLQSLKHSSSGSTKRENGGTIEGSRDTNKHSVGVKNSNSGPLKDTLRPNSGKSKQSVKESRPIQAVSISKTRDSSWGPVQASISDASSSAVSHQIQNVKGYLAQARQAGKQDEIKLFEDNLRELMMLERQQRGVNS